MKKVLWFVLIMLGLVLVGATILSLTVSSQMTIGNMFPAAVGVLLITCALLRLVRKKPLFGRRWLRVAAMVIVCIALLSFIVVQALIFSEAFPPPPEENADVVIVLGAGVFPDGRLTRTLQNRLDAAADYLRTSPNTVCIVSGGQGPHEPTTEAFAMKKYMVSIGIDSARIIEEGRSYSTYDNMTLSKQIMRQRDPDGDLEAIVVTSDFHMFRAKVLARRAGLNVQSITSRTPWYVWIPNFMREYLAVINTWLFNVEI